MNALGKAHVTESTGYANAFLDLQDLPVKGLHVPATVAVTADACLYKILDSLKAGIQMAMV